LQTVYCAAPALKWRKLVKVKLLHQIKLLRQVSEDGELHDLNLPSGGMSTDENTGEQACAAPIDGLVPVAPIKVTGRKDQAQNDCIPSDVSPSATALLDELYVAEKSLKSIR